MQKRRIAISVVVLLVLGGALLVVFARGSERRIEVQTTPATTTQIVEKINATARIQPKTQVKISADISAKIVRLGVREGDRVRKGQMLVELDRQRYLASVESESARVRSAQSNAALTLANKQQAERVLNRAKELFARKLESQSVVDSAQAAFQVEAARYQSALDEIEQARALLKQAHDDLSKTTIYAPMDGTISSLKRQVGEIAIGSQFQEDVIMIVADLGEMEALMDVNENDIARIRRELPAAIRVDALPNDTLTGHVSEVGNSARAARPGESLQKTEFEVRVAVASAAGQLRPGMSASVDVVTDSRDATLAVPLQSVTVRTMEQLAAGGGDTSRFVAGRDNYVPLVYVVENGKAHARQVKTGIQSDNLIEILSGVTAGEQVVSGSYRAISRDLRDGLPVSVVAEGGSAGAE